jgi:hypothetical protein
VARYDVSFVLFSFSLKQYTASVAWHGMWEIQSDFLSGFYDEDTLGLLAICEGWFSSLI